MCMYVCVFCVCVCVCVCECVCVCVCMLVGQHFEHPCMQKANNSIKMSNNRQTELIFSSRSHSMALTVITSST